MNSSVLRHTLVLLPLLCGAASGQVMTELSISTAGPDQEFVELQWTPGRSTDGLMFAAVESNANNAFVGVLDGLYDLGGGVINADGLFTVGNDQAAADFPGAFDATFPGLPGGMVSATTILENSNETYYLLDVPDAAQRASLLGLINTDVRSTQSPTATIFSETPGITILDVVSVIDDEPFTLFDGAAVVGPDTVFVPSGILRPGGCVSGWCNDRFLTFTPGTPASPPAVDASPGEQNPGVGPCIEVPGVGSGRCTGLPIGRAVPTCAVNPNSTGLTARTTGFGSDLASANWVVLEATDAPVKSFGIFLNAPLKGLTPSFGTNGQGNLCLDSAELGRFDRPGEVVIIGDSGSAALEIDLTDIPRMGGSAVASAGDTWFFQFWYRDVAGGMPASNLSSALELTFR